MTELSEMPIDAFCELLAEEGINRFYFVWDEDSGSVRASHERLQELAEFLQADAHDFDKHEGFFVQVGPRSGVLEGAAIHRTCRGQAAGGVRLWRYDTVADYLRDGLRLSMGMTHKNALAGLWWGGGKGIMAAGTGRHDGSPSMRRTMYEEYGELMTSLNGCYVTAEDVGTSVEDMKVIFSKTRFTTCIPESLGGSGNPSVPTAMGVVRGMEAALSHLKMGKLEGKSVAVQGLGHVGEPLLLLLEERGVAKVVGSDIDPARKRALETRFAGINLRVNTVDRGDNSILSEDVDLVAPCATGAILNPETIPTIRAKIVCGAANNQLANPERDDVLLEEAGVLYMPDFLVNRMGIVTCADESVGYIDDDPAIEAHLGQDWDQSIYNLSLAMLREAAETGRPLARVALDHARQRSFEVHPIWGHRGLAIVRSLVANHWELKGAVPSPAS